MGSLRQRPITTIATSITIAWLAGVAAADPVEPKAPRPWIDTARPSPRQLVERLAGACEQVSDMHRRHRDVLLHATDYLLSVKTSLSMASKVAEDVSSLPEFSPAAVADMRTRTQDLVAIAAEMTAGPDGAYDPSSDATYVNTCMCAVAGLRAHAATATRRLNPSAPLIGAEPATDARSPCGELIS